MNRARALWGRVPAPVVDLALVIAAAVDVRLNLWDDTRLGIALAALGCAALAFRRRFPLGVFLLTLPISLTQPVAVAPLAALFTLAERSRNRPLLGSPEQRALYRTVQEALTNVRKHAPGATACVELWQDGDGIGVTVTNTPPTRPSLSLPGSQQGLVGLRERAEILHGTLQAGPTAEGGYRVRLRIPFSAD